MEHSCLWSARAYPAWDLRPAVPSGYGEGEETMSELILDPRSTAVVVIDIQKGIAVMPGAALPGRISRGMVIVALGVVCRDCG